MRFLVYDNSFNIIFAKGTCVLIHKRERVASILNCVALYNGNRIDLQYTAETLEMIFKQSFLDQALFGQHSA